MVMAMYVSELKLHDAGCQLLLFPVLGTSSKGLCPLPKVTNGNG